jgi:hypothetical protein
MPLPAAPVNPGLPASALPVVPLLAAGVATLDDPACAMPRAPVFGAALSLQAAPAMPTHRARQQ